MTECLLQDAPELVQAVFIGGQSEVLTALRKEDVNSQDSAKRTALHAAACCGEAEIAALLLQENARVNAKDAKWYTPLHRACASKANFVVQVLLDNGADRNARDKCWQTPLHIATMNGSLECARLLLDGAANVNASDRGGHTPLHHAVLAGHLEVVRLLLISGASVNAFDKNDRRAMHWAASKDLTDMIDLLCEFNAEVNCRDRSQYTPLHVAAALGHVTVASQLISRGAELHALTVNGNTPLHIACLNGQVEMVGVLLDTIATRSTQSLDDLSSPCSPKIGTDELEPLSNTPRGQLSPMSGRSSTGAMEKEKWTLLKTISTQNAAGYTPLHLAIVSTGSAACLERLISATTKTNEETEEKDESSSLLDVEIPAGELERTPLHLAAAHGRHNRAQMLLELGANVSAHDRWGNTPLHYAASRGHELVLNILLEAGARWDDPGDGGATPLHVAASAGFSTCLARLLEVAQKEWKANGSTDNRREESDAGYPEYYQQIRQLMDDRGRGLVHAAALGGNVDCLRLVLFAGADPFTADTLSGRTPLHMCAIANTVANSSSLTTEDLGLAEVSPVSFFDRTKNIRGDLSESSAEVALILLKLGANPNAADSYGCTPLHLAAAYDTGGTLTRHFLAHGSDRFAAVSWPLQLGQQSLILTDELASPYGGEPNPEGVKADFNQGTLKSSRLRKDSITSNILATPLYYPLHLASAMGNTTSLRCLFGGISSKEACRLVLESANQSLLHEKMEESSPHFFLSPLFLAAFRGQTAAVDFLLDVCSPDKNSDFPGTSLPCGQITDPLGRTPLHYAAYAGHLDTCRLLVNHPASQANPLAKDSVYQWNAVQHAASQGHVAVVVFFLRWQAEKQGTRDASSVCLADTVDEHGRTPLMLAAQNRHPGVIELLLSPDVQASSRKNSGHSTTVARVDATDVYGRSALHRAAANGHIECMKLLIEAGATLTLADFRGRQALHFAATSGQTRCMELLVQALIRSWNDKKPPAIAGSTSAKESLAQLLCPLDLRGFTPLHLASFNGHLPCIRTLLECCSAYRQLRGNSFSPVHCATQRGHVVCLDPLLRCFGYSSLRVHDFRGRSPIHIAALSDQVDCLQCMVDFVNSESVPEGETESEGGEKRSQLLLSSPTLDGTARTPLMFAARAGAISVCRYLLSTMDPVSIAFALTREDSNGLTALHHALSCRSPSATSEETTLLLLEHVALDSRSLNKPTTDEGLTPLHLAVAAGYCKVVEALLARGVNLFALDNHGLLPICAGAKDSQIAKCLVSLLLAMMPNLKNKLPQDFLTHNEKLGGAVGRDVGMLEVRSSFCRLTDSIHSSDSEFY